MFACHCGSFFFFHRYTLLVGHPPFETKSLRETYNRIRNNEYTIPSRVSDNAAKLIKRMLKPNPADRPSLKEILADEFFTKGFFPNRLPGTCVTSSPKWSEYEKSGESDKKISKDAIKKITIALSRQMKLASDEKDDTMEKDWRVKEMNGECGGKLVSPSEKDRGISQSSSTPRDKPRDTRQEGRLLSRNGTTKQLRSQVLFYTFFSPSLFIVAQMCQCRLQLHHGKCLLGGVGATSALR